MTILMRAKFGSQLYGTNTPLSDTDYKSVFVPEAKDILLQKATGVLQKNTKVDSSLKNSAEDIDDESFSIHQFLKMIRSGDMIATELLFIPFDKLETFDDGWKYLCDFRYELISSDVKGFLGYCRKQAAKYGIKGSRVAAMRAVRDQFIKLKMDERVGNYHWDVLKVLEYEHPDNIFIKDIQQSNGTTLTHFEVCNRLIPYTIKVRDAYNIVDKIFNEYGSRSLMAESNQGVDWKALSHAIRVSEQTIELLETGLITFPRVNAQTLIKIKEGNYPYKEVAEELETNLDTIEHLSNNCTTLNKKINNDLIDLLEQRYHIRKIEELQCH